jgi:hypothetical protein
MKIGECGSFIHKEIAKMVCGTLLGEGIGRRVYEYLPDPRYVVKVEYEGGSFQNIVEWEAWQDIQYTKWAEWFAPCLQISPNGAVLLQERTTPATKRPPKLPNFMSDLKKENFGMIGNKLVCHDYGYNLLTTRGLSNGRLVKPRYWSA